MDHNRRNLLRSGTAAAVLLPLLGGGLLVPHRVMAAEWNRNAFTAKTLGDALKAGGASNAQESRDITINAPEIAENGAKVEVEISCNLPGARNLQVYAEKNPMPLCGSFDFAPPALPYAKLQLKLAETMRIRAVVKAADGKQHVAFREIKITLGGCGG